MQNNVSIVDYLKRPEFVTLIVAGLVNLAVGLGLPEKAGLPLPEAALNNVVLVGWAVFLGALLEGSIKKVDYVGTLKGIFVDSFKMRSLYVSFGVIVLGGLAKANGVEVADETLAELIGFVVAIVLGKGTIDAASAALAKVLKGSKVI